MVARSPHEIPRRRRRHPFPDGQLLLWTERYPVISAEKSENLTHIFLGAANGSGRFQLTRGDKSATSARFSPNGASVYFLSERSGKPNIYRIPVAGGEAEAITDWKGVIASYEVSPDGKRIAFAGRDEDKDGEKRKKEKLDFKVIGDRPTRNSLWIASLGGEFPAKPEKLVSGEFHIVGLDWSPDSAKIAFHRVPRSDADVARHADLGEVDVASRAVRDLAASDAEESDPRYSPDGRWIAFLRQPSGNPVSSAVKLVLLDRTTGTSRELTGTPDEQPRVAGWAADSKSLVFSEVERYRGVLYRIPLDGPVAKVHESLHSTISSARLNSSGTHIAFVRQSSTEPPEAWAAPLFSSSAIRVSAANANIELPAFGKTEIIQWKSKDGLDVDGLLTYPVGYRAGQRVPLILNIHGGPAGAFLQDFDGAPGRYPIATFAAKGYAVLRPNPRGSAGRGAPFRARVIEDWGGRDFGDLMAGVDHAIAMGVADPERLAVMGWSYGGYMTAWTVTQTRRFKAAAIGAGVVNHVSMYGTHDIPSFYEDHFGGAPWENRKSTREARRFNS